MDEILNLIEEAKAYVKKVENELFEKKVNYTQYKGVIDETNDYIDNLELMANNVEKHEFIISGLNRLMVNPIKEEEISFEEEVEETARRTDEFVEVDDTQNNELFSEVIETSNNDIFNEVPSDEPLFEAPLFEEEKVQEIVEDKEEDNNIFDLDFNFDESLITEPISEISNAPINEVNDDFIINGIDTPIEEMDFSYEDLLNSMPEKVNEEPSIKSVIVDNDLMFVDNDKEESIYPTGLINTDAINDALNKEEEKEIILSDDLFNDKVESVDNTFNFNFNEETKDDINFDEIFDSVFLDELNKDDNQVTKEDIKEDFGLLDFNMPSDNDKVYTEAFDMDVISNLFAA